MSGRAPSRPAITLPKGACDAHAHVFGPVDQFPPAGTPSYAIPEAPYERYAAMLTAIGASRGVLVQPTLYGTRNDALTAALRSARSDGRLQVRGIAAADATVTDAELQAMQEAGVRGLRFIEMLAPGGVGRYPGGVSADQLPALASRMKDLGWHAQLWCPIEDHARRLPGLVKLGVPLVIDHMGCFKVEQGVAAAAFQQLLGLVRDGEVWVKLSLCRNSRLFPDYPDIRGFHDALIGANASRLLWGSDWPHVRMADLAPDPGHLVDLFDAWVNDAAIRHLVFVDNPATLFDFDRRLEHPHG